MNKMEIRKGVLVIMLITVGFVLVQGTIIQPFLTFAHSRPRTFTTLLKMDSSHKFSLEYKSIPFMASRSINWRVNLTTKADPQTKPIDNVTYVINLNPDLITVTAHNTRGFD